MAALHISRRGLFAAGAAGLAGTCLVSGSAEAGVIGWRDWWRRPYRWSNVEIVGGGFIPGIVFNRTEPGLVYVRTDIGGAYRWDTCAKRWIPLLDWVGWDNWGYTGVASLATDPVDPDRVYAAVGTYTNGSDPNNGAILRSRDRGTTWQTTPLPFKLGGNMPGRGIGERLAIDPNRNDILYLAAPSGNGLWRSTDQGAHWQQVTSFPNAGTFVPNPSDPSGYSSDKLGVLWVVFDPRSGRRGRPTQTIYVGVGDVDNIVYRSTDAGRTWERVAGQPTGYLPHKAVLDEQSGILYLATSNTAGPYDGSKGDVWKYDTASGAWTRISPVPSTDSGDYFGYSGLTLDRQRPGTIMVATQISWWPDVVFFRSTDFGATWTRSWDYAGYPNRVNRYDIDYHDAPWLDFDDTNPQPPTTEPKLGWMTESMEIDPFNSDRLFYGTGATLYGTENLTAWDAGKDKVHIAVRARGIEETAVLDLVSPPVGPHLFSAVSDVTGFAHADFTNAGHMYDNPRTAATLDYAELAPTVIVRAGDAGAGAKHVGISRDSGTTWAPAVTEPGAATKGGSIAVSADGTTIVWAPGGAPVSVTTDGGASWTACGGLPAGASVRSDRVDPGRFYAFAAGVFYASTDGGKSFQATSATGLPASGNVQFKAVPGFRGDLWLAGGTDKPGVPYGLWRSTDFGASFRRLTTVDQADAVGFGMAAPGSPYPAVFVSARIRGVRGIFRSDDAGGRWERVNDDRHQYGWTGRSITGDPRVYGRVYVGTNGRGIVLGEPATVVE